MKVRIVAEVDFDSGQYELEFHNLTNPGEGIDYHVLRELMRRIFADVGRRVDGDDASLDGAIIKDVH